MVFTRHFATQDTGTASAVNDQRYIAGSKQLLQDARPALPRFAARGDNIRPLLSPSQFYNEMKVSDPKAIILARIRLYFRFDVRTQLDSICGSLGSYP